MKKLLCIAVAVLLMMSAVCAVPVSADDLGESVVYASVNGVLRYDYAQEVLSLINAERAAAGLTPLKMSAPLTDNAMLRSVELSMYFDHSRPDDTPFYTVFSNDDYGQAAECIGGEFPSNAAVMKAWMEGEDDRSKILYAPFEFVGVGVFEADGVFYWDVLFMNGVQHETTDRNDKEATSVDIQIKRKHLHFTCPQESFLTCTLYAFKPYVLLNGRPLTTDGPLTVTIGDESIAVLQDGMVFAKNPGHTTMTLKVGGFCTFEIPLTVQKDYCADLNKDNKVDSTDARLTLQYAVGKLNDQTLPDAKNGDVNNDGKVDSTDARLILQYAVGKFTHFSESF